MKALTLLVVKGSHLFYYSLYNINISLLKYSVSKVHILYTTLERLNKMHYYTV